MIHAAVSSDVARPPRGLRAPKKPPLGAALADWEKEPEEHVRDMFVLSGPASPRAMPVSLVDIDSYCTVGHSSAAYAESDDPAASARVAAVVAGDVSNGAEMRELYGLPPGAPASRHVAALLLDLYCNRFEDDYGDSSAQPATALDSLRGSFAVLLYDSASGYVLAARDARGDAPLFWGLAADGTMLFSTEASEGLEEFPAGHFYECSEQDENGYLARFTSGSHSVSDLMQMCRPASTGDLQAAADDFAPWLT